MSDKQLPYNPITYKALKMAERDCPSCKGKRETFEQEYSTIPQPSDPRVMRVHEVFCAACGTCIDSQQKVLNQNDT